MYSNSLSNNLTHTTMADSSPEKQSRSPIPHPMPESSSREFLHKTKSIHFFGRPTPIVLQNDNGPCPLLAICNILLLRNQLNLSAEISEVSQEKLLSLVAERLLDSNSNVDNKDARYVKNLHQNIADAMDLLPCLTTGVDVNVKFRRIGDFEFTRECAIFDLLDIPLYHGWLVDPQDYDTAKAIGSKSYNTITAELVLLQETNRKGKGTTEEGSVDLVAATTTTLGIPSPYLSKNESFNDSPRASSDRPTTGKGDAEEEAELLRILELSKMDIDSPCAENLTTNSDKNLHQITFTSTNSADKLHENHSVELDVVSTHEQYVQIQSCQTEDRETQHPASTKLESDFQAQSTPETSLNEETYKENTIENPTLMSPNCDSSSGNAQNSLATESFNSTLNSSEPTYEGEGEECMWDSAAAVCEDREPVYEGQGTVGKRVDGSSLDVYDSSSNDEMTVTDGELINNFLQSSASQLTYYGLFCLQKDLKERELCVFFRNNHFSTAFKFEGGLYMLMTDHGYLNAPGIIWEKLNDISGASVFYDSNFKEFMPESEANGAWGEQNTVTSTTDYLRSTGNFTQDDSSFNSDLELARALQEQEHEQQQQRQQQRLATQQPLSSGRSRLVTCPQTSGSNARTSSNREKKPKDDRCSIM